MNELMRQDPRLAEERCTSTTRLGARCKNPARDGGLCAVHAKVNKNVTAAVFSEDPWPRQGNSSFPAVGRWQNTWRGAHQALLSALVAPARGLGTQVRSALARSRRGFARLRIHPPDIARIDGATGWSVASAVAVGMAGFLVWGGLLRSEDVSPRTVIADAAQQPESTVPVRHPADAISADRRGVERPLPARASTDRGAREAPSDGASTAGPAPASTSAAPAPAPALSSAPAPVPTRPPEPSPPPPSDPGTGPEPGGPGQTPALPDPIGQVGDLVHDVEGTLP